MRKARLNWVAHMPTSFSQNVGSPNFEEGEVCSSESGAKYLLRIKSPGIL